MCCKKNEIRKDKAKPNLLNFIRFFGSFEFLICLFILMDIIEFFNFLTLIIKIIRINLSYEKKVDPQPYTHLADGIFLKQLGINPNQISDTLHEKL